MFYLIHILAGVLIGLYAPNLFIIIVLSLIIHFVLDSIPHWDGDFDKEKLNRNNIAEVTKSTFLLRLADLIFGAIILFIVYFNIHNINILYGAIVSVLPDFIKIFYYSPLRKSRIFMGYLKFHGKIQKEVSVVIGLLMQGLVGIFLLIFIIGRFLFLRYLFII
jgi:hypothetical protein